MANEIEISASLKRKKNDGVQVDLAVVARLFNQSGNPVVQGEVSVATTEAAIDLGGITGTLGWALFMNLDYTNFVEIRSATGAANDIIKIPARGVALFYFGSNMTAPFIIADTAACLVQYAICTA